MKIVGRLAFFVVGIVHLLVVMPQGARASIGAGFFNAGLRVWF